MSPDEQATVTDPRPDQRSLPVRKPRRPDPRPPRTRQAILKAGHGLMTSGGLEAATISAIADAAHVAVGSIYAHFSGKEALVLEVFLDRVEPAIDAFVVRAASLAPPARLREAGAAMIDFAVDEPALAAALVSGKLLAVADAAEGPRQRVLALGREVLELLERDIASVAAAAGDGRGEDAALLLTFWLGLMGAVARSDSLAISGERARELLERQLRVLST